MRHFPFAVSAGLVLLACSPDEQTGPQRSTSPDLALSTAQYTTVDLGTLGGTSSEAFAINPAGQVVGRSTPSANTPPRAFLWENGRMRNIGQDVGGSGSVALDINEIGQVAGTFTRTDGTTRGFVWQNGSVRRIGTLGGRNSRVTGINRTGQVTGYSETSTGEVHPFLWQNGVMKDLAQPVGTQRFQYAYGISNHTHIVGGTASRPVLWTSGTARTLDSPNGGAAFAVNNNGHAVGYGWTLEEEPNQHAALWKDGVYRDLGTLGGNVSIAFDISDVGLVVGTAERAGGAARPFVWKTGTMTELPTLGGTSGSANGTNRGKIVGASRTASGQLHATLWLPPS